MINENIKYKYDNMGNITKVYKNGELVTEYKYDALCRLVRENNKELNKTNVYSYDNKGNILTQKEYPFTLKCDEYLEELSAETKQYVYSNGKLISYNGENISYDVLGNPTTYRGNTLSWLYINRLTSFGETTFEYDGEGKRIRKNNIEYMYDIDGRLITQSNGLKFYYDENNSPISFVYDNNMYFYKKDLLGNVIEILDTDSSTVVKYVYDAWGNHTVTDYTDFGLGNLNPYRYRSYYYDTETGLYFLQTRYYDPQTGRFISMDDIDYLDPETIGGTNLYAYCLNNPVMYVDPTGYSAIALLSAIGIGALLGATFDIGKQVVLNNGNWKKIDWGSVTSSAIIGAALGFAGTIGGTTLGVILSGTKIASSIGVVGWLAISGGVAFTGGFTGYTAKKLINNEEWNWRSAIAQGTLTAISGLFAFGTGAISSLVNVSGGFGQVFYEKIARNFVTDIFSQPISWLMDLIGENAL